MQSTIKQDTEERIGIANDIDETKIKNKDLKIIKLRNRGIGGKTGLKDTKPGSRTSKVNSINNLSTKKSKDSSGSEIIANEDDLIDMNVSEGRTLPQKRSSVESDLEEDFAPSSTSESRDAIFLLSVLHSKCSCKHTF